MKTWSKRNKILLGLLLLFIVAQAVRPAKNEGNPAGPRDLASVVTVPDSIQTILKNSCYDCHSDHSDYPWYDRVTPVNWWVNHHIQEGKRQLNFTHFGEYPTRKMAKKLEETVEQVERGEMPLPSYLWMHGDARLSTAQQRALIEWAKGASQQVTK